MRPALVLAVLLALPARAHEVIGSVIFIDLGEDRVQLEVEVPMDELRLAFGLDAQPGVVAPPAPDAALVQYVEDHVSVKAADGAPFVLRFTLDTPGAHDDRNWLRVRATATPPAGHAARDFVVESDLVNHRVTSHRVFVFLRDDARTGRLGAAPLFVDVLHYQRHQTHFTREPGSRLRAWTTAFRVGAEHLQAGSDHLAFLLAVLTPLCLIATLGRWGAPRSPAAVGRAVLRVVTAFTIGHSVTLVLGALGVAPLPASVVEPLIAASIVVSALHVARPLFPRHEATVALLFGLVHGLGFAGALDGLGVDGVTLALTAFGFNAGIEVMQSAVVLLTMPFLHALLSSPAGRVTRLGVAAVTFSLGAGWLVERVAGVAMPSSALASALFSWPGLAVLAGVTAAARWRRSPPVLQPESRLVQ